MKCPKCSFDNKSGKKFCTDCGAKLSMKCSSCDSELDGGEKFCGECGQPLQDCSDPKFKNDDQDNGSLSPVKECPMCGTYNMSYKSLCIKCSHNFSDGVPPNKDMDTGDEGVRICPKCGMKNRLRKISVGLIQECDDCGNVEYLDEKENGGKSTQNEPIFEVDAFEDESIPPERPRFTEYSFLLGATLLHVLFCAQSPLLFISANYPMASIAKSIGYSIPGMIFSIIIFVPLISYFSKDNDGKGFSERLTPKSIRNALLIGAAFRLVSFLF